MCIRDRSKLETEIKELKEAISAAEEKNRQLDKEAGHLQIQISQFNGRKKTIEEMEANYEGYNLSLIHIYRNCIIYKIMY